MHFPAGLRALNHADYRRFFIGQVVSLQQGTAGNVPLAAALSLVPIVVIALFLWGAKRLGAFDAL